MTVVVEVNGPGHKGSMIGRRPGISSEVHKASVLLENLIDAFAAVLEDRLDVPSDGGRRGDDGGRAASLHHRDELRIGNDLGGPGTFNTPAGEMSSSFFRGMRAMGNFDRRLALSRKAGKDRTVPTDGRRFGSKGCIDDGLAEASYGVGLQIGCCTAVLRILEAPNAVETLVSAALCSTLEEMVFAFFVVADRDVAFEELVDWRAPRFLETS
jgi:hypothetical protein